MNTLHPDAVELARRVAEGATGASVEVGVAPPFVYLRAVRDAVGETVLVGAQDAYFERSGAYTGEISTDMLLDCGVRFCLAGHSERRHVLHESPELVSAKAHAIYGAGMILVHCVGETLQQRDAGQTLAVVSKQLDELQPRRIEDPQRLVIAYEPVWAIGTGRNATDEQAQEVHRFIRTELERRWNRDFASRVRIQYGGSLKPENATGLFRMPDIDGGLVGGASLKAESFLSIVRAAGKMEPV